MFFARPVGCGPITSKLPAINTRTGEGSENHAVWRGHIMLPPRSQLLLWELTQRISGAIWGHIRTFSGQNFGTVGQPLQGQKGSNFQNVYHFDKKEHSSTRPSLRRRVARLSAAIRSRVMTWGRLKETSHLQHGVFNWDSHLVARVEKPCTVLSFRLKIPRFETIKYCIMKWCLVGA